LRPIRPTLFRIAQDLHLPSLLRSFLRSFANNPPIVFFCHRILPPESKFSRLDQFYHQLGHPTAEEFESQLRYLTRYHSIISLEDVVDYISGIKILPPSPAVITFDDGYLDNYRFAFPLLKKYNAKATFFICTDFIGTGKIPFHDCMIYGLCCTKKKKVHLNDNKGNIKEYLLDTLIDKSDSFFKIQTLFKRLPYGLRATFVKNLIAELEVKIEGDFSRDLMLTWKEIKAMHLFGYSFYTHTRSHPLLINVSDTEIEKEILESNKILCEQLETDGNLFCYPYGKKGEFDESTINFLKVNGFIAACSAIHGINRKGDDPYNVKRTAMISEPIEIFSLRSSGLFEIIKEFQSKWRYKITE